MDFSYQATQIVNTVDYYGERIASAFKEVLGEYARPSTIYKPTLTQDGNAWLAILGDLPTGVVGCGDSPADAMRDFDLAWNTKAEAAKVVG